MFPIALNTPVGIGIITGILTLIYLIIVSISPILASAVILSIIIGYLVYSSQKQCIPVMYTTPSNVKTK